MKDGRCSRLTATVRLLSIIAAAGAMAAPAAAGNTESGKKIYGKCKVCQQVGEGARNRIGPILNGMVERPAGAKDGFRFSRALSDSGLTWDEEALAAFLANPRRFLPGNRMAFAGLRSETEIADVIAYMASFAPDGTRL